MWGKVSRQLDCTLPHFFSYSQARLTDPFRMDSQPIYPNSPSFQSLMSFDTVTAGYTSSPHLSPCALGLMRVQHERIFDH